MVQIKAAIFKEVPVEWPEPHKHLTIEAQEFDPDAAPPKGGVTLKTYYCSIDPYMRSRMRRPEIKSYAPAFALGKPMVVYGIGRVLKSDNSKLQPGDVVFGFMPMQEYSTVDGDGVKDIHKVANPWGLDYSLFLGALGMPGLTAYSSMCEIGKPKKGETIFVSAASGAVGQIVGQMCKHEGLRVIGSVGTDDKLDFILKELNFDGGWNYKKEKTADALARLAPQGIDIYYENVGGEQLEAALNALNNYGRVVVCGMISQYNLKPQDMYGVRSLANLVAKRLTLRGFIVGDAEFGPKYYKEHQEKMGQWISDGTFKAKQSFTDGIDKAPEAIVGMLKGENFGKSVLRIAHFESDQ